MIKGNEISIHSKEIDQLIAKTIEQHQYPISFGSCSISLSGIELENVTYNGSTPFAADKITIAISYRLHEWNWTIPKVTVSGLTANISHRDLIRIFDRAPSSTSSKKKHHFKIADQVVINDSYLTISNRAQPEKPITLSSVDMEYRSDDKFATIRVKNISIGKKNLKSNTSITLKKNSKESWFYLIQPNEDKEHSWNISGKIAPYKKRMTISIKSSIYPDIIKDFIPIKINSDLISAIKANINYSKGTLYSRMFIGMSNLSIQHKTLGPRIIGPIPARIRMTSSYSFKKDQLKIKLSKIQLKPQNVHPQLPLTNLSGKFEASDLRKSGYTPTINFQLILKKTPCYAIQSAIPDGLTPIMSHFKMEGNAGFSLIGKVPLKSPSSFTYDLSHSFNCTVNHASYKFSRTGILKRYSPSPSFSKSINNNYLSKVRRNYTAHNMISPYVFNALIGFEDGGFYTHKGIDLGSIIKAIRTNISEKKIRLGGSTITMQTVKNAFLTHERTISRKLQELFLTWHIENILSKREILEIYANIIEFGPNIYGIRDAALTYFNKDPHELNLLESAYLASVLPSPIKRFKNYCRGGISKSYMGFLQRRLRLMHEFKKISAKDLYNSESTTLTFASSAHHPYCQRMASSESSRMAQ